jgi:hypothetical protein
MTQRERYLAIAVGVVVALLGANMGFKKITTTLTQKENRVTNAQNELDSLNNDIASGRRAIAKIQRLEAQSLPRKRDEAESQYIEWLYQLAKDLELNKVNVNRVGEAQKEMPVGLPAGSPEAFTVYEFHLYGECTTDKVVDLLARYYDRDYLHRIRSLKITPVKQQPNRVGVDLSSQVISLPKAPEKKEPSLLSSGRLAKSIDDYKMEILERNLFSPPNNAPKIATAASHDVTIGTPWKLDLEAKDTDGHNVKFELLTEKDKLPKDFSLRGKEISWKPTEKTTQEILIRATDDGWPRKSTELKLALKAVDAPAPKVEAKPETVDPAKQAFLTGLVSGRGGAQGWIRSKAEALNIDISEGTEINIGSVKATVVKIDLAEDHIELETEGSRWFADMDTSLAEAYSKSKAD